MLRSRLLTLSWLRSLLGLRPGCGIWQIMAACRPGRVLLLAEAPLSQYHTDEYSEQEPVVRWVLPCRLVFVMVAGACGCVAVAVAAMCVILLVVDVVLMLEIVCLKCLF